MATSSLSIEDLNHESLTAAAVHKCINQCRQNRFDTDAKTKTFSAETKFKAWKGGAISSNKDTAAAKFIRRILADPTKTLTPAQQKYVDDHPHLLDPPNSEMTEPLKRKRTQEAMAPVKVWMHGEMEGCHMNIAVLPYIWRWKIYVI